MSDKTTTFIGMIDDYLVKTQRNRGLIPDNRIIKETSQNSDV